MFIDPLCQSRAQTILIESFGARCLENLDAKGQEEVAHFLHACAQDMAGNALKYFRPFEWQKQFWKLGAYSSRRAAIAANRTGKTEATTYEVACHLTGIYPEWWEGKRFKGAINCIACGDSWTDIAKTLQKKLLGVYDISQRGAVGSGLIPRDSIDIGSIRTNGPNCEYITIKHQNGGTSNLWFAVYTQDRSHLQGFELHLTLFDEQPPDDINSELLTRMATTSGHAIYSFTPIKGATGVVQRFEEHETGYDFLRVGWDDLPEYNAWGEAFFLKADREQLARDYAPYERDARMRGIPMAGMGAIFPLLEFPQYTSSDFAPLNHPDFERIIALDLGLVLDPTVITFALRDPYEDIIYIHRQVVLKNHTVEQYISYLTSDDSFGIPIVLPADAHAIGRYTLDSLSVRQTLDEKYRLNVVPGAIMNPPDDDGKVNNRIDYGLNVMRVRMEHDPPTLVINSQCKELLMEMRNLYINEKSQYQGRIDCIDSARYAILGFLNGHGITKDFRRHVRTNQAHFAQVRDLFKKPHKPLVKDLYKG